MVRSSLRSPILVARDEAPSKGNRRPRIFVRDLAVALIAALVFTGALALSWGLRRFAPASFVWPFLVLFLAAWAGGVWIAPVGPRFWGGYFLPFLAVAFVMAVLIAAAKNPLRERLRPASGPDERPDPTTIAALTISVFLWVVLFSLFGAIVTFYVMR